MHCGFLWTQVDVSSSARRKIVLRNCLRRTPSEFRQGHVWLAITLHNLLPNFEVLDETSARSCAASRQLRWQSTQVKQSRKKFQGYNSKSDFPWNRQLVAFITPRPVCVLCTCSRQAGGCLTTPQQCMAWFCFLDKLSHPNNLLPIVPRNHPTGAFRTSPPKLCLCNYASVGCEQ